MKIAFSLIIVMFSFLSMLVFADSTEESDSLFKEGVKFFEMGEFEKAISYFDQVLEIEPNYIGALAKKGDALIELGKIKEAVVYFDKLITIAPYYKDEKGLYIDKLLLIEPNHVEALYKRGKSLSIFSNQLDNAIFFFDKALEIDPDRPDIITSKGEVLVNQEKFEEAISYFDKALEIDPQYMDALRGKGDALANLGKFEEAHSFIDRALEIQPNNPVTLLKKGDAFRLQQNYDEAYSYFHKVLEIEPENFLAKNKFKLIHSLLNFTEFDGSIETIVRDSQGNLIAHLKDNKVKHLDHELFQNIVNEWNVTKIVNRNGTDYEVRQHEILRNELFRTFHGGAGDYGLTLHDESLISADNWFYEVDSGDTFSLVFTVFNPIS